MSTQLRDQSQTADVASLYAQHHGWLYDWLQYRLGDTFLAEDLAQDAFVTVLAAGNVEQIREPRPFLATIARRLMAHHYRRKVVESSYLEMLACVPEELAPSPEDRLQALQALHQIDAALAALPTQVSEAFLLAHLQGLSYAEIAKQLDVSVSSVKQYLSRANRHCLFAIAV